MATRRRAESSILESVRNTVAGLHKAGLMDEATMRQFGDERRRVVRIVDLTEKEIEEMTSGRMSPEHDHLNALLDKE